MTFHEWLVAKEGIWLFYVLLISIAVETYMVILQRIEIHWAKREFDYDEQKDIEKKQRRTKTTKKTTVQPGGGSVVEESTETSEPMKDESK